MTFGTRLDLVNRRSGPREPIEGFHRTVYAGTSILEPVQRTAQETTRIPIAGVADASSNSNKEASGWPTTETLQNYNTRLEPMVDDST